MVDALEYNNEIAEERSQILEWLGLASKQYLVLTVHRPANTDNREHMENIIGAVGAARMPVVFPVHPRTKKVLEEYGMWNRLPANIIVTEPLGYLDMLKLMRHACKILTDSGGIQKEAYILGVPCITLRDVTEWVETVEDGGNVLAGSDNEKIMSALIDPVPAKLQLDLYPEGAVEKIRTLLNKGSGLKRNR